MENKSKILVNDVVYLMKDFLHEGELLKFIAYMEQKEDFEEIIQFVLDYQEVLDEDCLSKIASLIIQYIKANEEIKNNFVINFSNFSLLKYDEQLLKFSLNNDFKSTFDNLLKYSDKISDNVKNELLIYVDENFDELFNKITGIEKIIDMDNAFKLYADKYVCTVPDAVLASEKFLKHEIPNISEIQIQGIQDVVLNSEYSEELEKIFLSTINGGFANIEEYVKSYSFSNLEYKYVSLLQRVGLKLYCQKKLYLEGIQDVSVNFIVENADVRGLYNNKIINLYHSTNSLITPVSSMLTFLLHEKNHAIQEFNIEQGAMDKDLDVFVYSKDELLQKIDESYYDRNYTYVLSEFDAEFEARMEVNRLQGIEIDSIYKKVCDEINEAIKNNKKTLLNSMLFRYAYKIERKNEKGKFEGQETLFIKKLKKRLKENPSYKEEIVNSFPMIAMGYDLDNFGKPRTLKEMLKIINESENDRVKEMCWFIIKERFDFGRLLKREKNWIYGDYKIESIKKYSFKKETTRNFALDFAYKLEQKFHSNSVEKYSKSTVQ